MPRCSTCHEDKEPSEFAREPRVRSGLSARCRRCHSERTAASHKARYAADPEAGRARGRAAYARDIEKSRAYVRARAAARRAADPQVERDKVRAWALANPEKVKAGKAKRRARIRETDRAWRTANRDKVNAYWRERWAAHPELLSVRCMKRHARKMNAPGPGVTAADWSSILECFDHRCAYCLAKAETLEMDHVVALVRGGEHSPDNVVPACTTCNSSKKARPVIACFAPGLIVAERMGKHFSDAA